MTPKKALMPNNRERTIDALARNNNIIKSLFHYDKPITFLITSLAIQKIKVGAHQGGLVAITRPEIKSLIRGGDVKIGINKLIKSIRLDLETHNFFNLYSPNSGLQDIRQGLIQRTALTKDLFKDLIIHFDENMFDVFKSTENYTIQYLDQLRNCKENQTTIIYTLTQPYAKPTSPDFKISILELRAYLRIADDAYTAPKTLTMRVKKICAKVTKKTNINLSVTSIKKNGTTGATIGYSFHSDFKDQNQKQITSTKTIKTKPIHIRQQLTNWGVSKDQINIWINNLTPKKINDAIEQTIEKSKNNPGGYIYQILGDGKRIESATQIKKNKEVVGCLKKFGLSTADIAKAQKKTKKHKIILLAVTNKCLRAQANDESGTENMRQFFNDQLETSCNDFKVDL